MIGENDKKILVKNFLYLTMNQGINYILPIITLPYLVRVLSPDKYGLISFSRNFVQYFILITDYGFNLTATREISICKNDRNKVSEIYSSVMYAKIMLLVLSFVILLLVLNNVGKFNKDKVVYYLYFITVIGNVFYPVWFFQGMEKMKYITLLNVITKSIFTVFVFLFVERDNDYVYVPLFYSSGYILIGIIAQIIVYTKFKIGFHRPIVKKIIEELRIGFYVFVSTIIISSYTITNTFLLGIFSNNISVAYFYANDRIIRTVTLMFKPVVLTLYPYVSRTACIDKKKFFILMDKILKKVFIISIILFLVIILFSRYIIFYVLGKEYLSTINVFRILSILIIIIPVAYLLFNVILLALKQDKHYFLIYLKGSIINILTLIILLAIFKLGVIGACIAIVTTEIFITFNAYKFYNKIKS